jgi:hypothetical protein
MRANRERISPLRTKLKPYDARFDDWKAYADKFLHPMSWPKQWEVFDFSVVADHPNYQEWCNEQSSQVLLLQGRNRLRSGYHWLSAAPLKYIQSHEQEGGRPLFVFLHPDPYLTEDVHVPQPTIISLLIWQFLERFPEVSEDTSFFEDVQSRIDGNEWVEEDCSEQYQLLADLLSRRPVTHVIIDRLDSCTCPVDTFVQNLLSLCAKVTGVVKFMVVVGGKTMGAEDIVSKEKARLRIIERDQQKRKKH